ncbi:MAG: endolytic transglycosylase MltG [Syntrophales bacterium]|nr:endolytic transglycosylase MltG [Syntrophales bacterium]
MTKKWLKIIAATGVARAKAISLNMVRNWRKTIVVIGVACAMVVSLLCLIFFNYASSPIDFVYREVTVEIPRGISFDKTANILEEAGLLRHKKGFYLLAFVTGASKHIQAGEYDLRSSMSPMTVLERLVKGKVKEYPVFIPEGFTLLRIATRLENQGLADRDLFISLASDSRLLSSLGIEGESAEGYLFPDTHTLNKSMGEEVIIRFMVRQFRKVMTPGMLERADELGLTEDEVVTLASIIEKEGGPKEEKLLVSAVFHNRLKKGMRLQSDPTVIYDIEDFDGNLRKTDLQRKTPYNTYRIQGLPPGPICNPGREAIEAALYPAPVNFLYFVSKNNGSHHFSSNLMDHNRAVLKYQIKRRE